MLPIESIENSLKVKESGSPELEELQNALLNLNADLRLNSRLSILKAGPENTEVLTSTDPYFKKGDPYYVSEAQWNRMRAHLSASSGFQNQGSGFWIEALSPLFGPDGNLLAILSIHSPQNDFFFQILRFTLHYVFLFVILLAGAISLHFLLTGKLRSRLKNLAAQEFLLVQDSSEPIVAFDQGLNFIEANPKGVELFEMSSNDLRSFQLFSEQLSLQIIPLDQTRESIEKKLQSRHNIRFKAKLVKAGDFIAYSNVKVIPATFQSFSEGYLMSFELMKSANIQPHLEDQENLSLEDSEYLDPITHLPNRSYFIVKMKNEISSHQSSQSSIIFFDIDDFRYFEHINGREKSEDLLRMFARRLKSFFRQSDLVLHGESDHFIAVLPSTPPRTAAQLVQNFAKELKQIDLQANDSVLRNIFFSAGISQINSGDSAEAWLERAEQASHQVKTEGKAGVHIHSA